MINMLLPAEQVIDTMELLRLPTHKRYLGLRFLAGACLCCGCVFVCSFVCSRAAHLLQAKIQEDTHDSIEDARTALSLYHRYEELRARGTLQSTLEELYRIGNEQGFRV